MAKKILPKNRKGQGSSKSRKGNVGELDVAGRAWARLLRDPCNAAMAHPCYTGGGTGYLLRFEWDSVINNSGTDTGAAAYFAPGYYSNCTVDATNFGFGGIGLNSVPITSGSQSLTLISSGVPARQPGYDFLVGAASQFRSVAACIQVTYPGSEQSRAGIVALGQTTLRAARSPVSLDGLRTTATNVSRMVDGTLELRMVPNEASALWCTPGDGPDAPGLVAMDDTPALFVSVAGIPVSTGVRVRFVNVVEWIPKINGVNTPNAEVPPTSRNTTTEVLQALYKAGSWAYTIPGAGAFAVHVAKGLAKTVLL